MTETDRTAARERDYSAFDRELTHQALDIRLFLRLLRWARPYRGTLSASAVLIVASSGLSSLIPVLQSRIVVDEILAPSPAAAEMPHYHLLTVLDWLTETLPLAPLTAAVLMYVALVALQTVMQLARQLLLTSGALKTLRDLRTDLFATLERKPAAFYDRVSVGRVITRLTNDVENLHELLVGFVDRAGVVFPFFISLAIMLDMSVHLTGVGLAIVPFSALGTYYFRKVVRQVFRRVRDSVSALNRYMQDDLIGMEVVQLSGREEMNSEQYGRLNRANRDREYRAIDYEVVFESFNVSLASIATVCILWFGGGQVIQESISLGVLIMFTQYINMMIHPIESVGRFFNTLLRAMASGERIFQALDWDERLHEPTDPVTLPERLEGAVEFRDARFAYPGGEPVLRGVSCRIEPGERLAIVGHTGSGKSTLIRLLARFYDLDDGMIFLDGTDVNRISSNDLRRRVGIVPQDFHIFSGTVLDNISLNNPEITRERAVWAARAVHADPFVRELADGYDTHLAARGHNLSQGQRQLLAFARVLAADPEILVLDEATSNIDAGTELVIQDALRKLTEDRTSIVIAHRLQTVRECDRVLVLHHGVVEEFGTHEELIARRGIYHTLHELQFRDSGLVAEPPGDTRETERRPRWVEPGLEDEEEPPFTQEV